MTASPHSGNGRHPHREARRKEGKKIRIVWVNIHDFPYYLDLSERNFLIKIITHCKIYRRSANEMCKDGTQAGWCRKYTLHAFQPKGIP